MKKMLLTATLSLICLIAMSQDSTVVIHNNGNRMAVRHEPDVDGKVVWYANSGDTVMILKGDISDYVWIRRHHSIEKGYIHQIFFTGDRKATEMINKSARNKITYRPLPSRDDTKKAKPASSSGSSNRTINTGPRGGRYYINSKGKKVYVK